MPEFKSLTIETLLNRYSLGERNFSGTRVYAENLRGVDLSEVDLCGSELDGDWSGVNLTKARLCGVIMADCDFQEANLSRANMSGAVFTQCDMTGSNFSHAILCGIALKQTVAYNANFTTAFLRGAFLEEAGLDGANMTDADLRGADGVSVEILQYFGCILSNTIMPDGSIYSNA